MCQSRTCSCSFSSLWVSPWLFCFSVCGFEAKFIFQQWKLFSYSIETLGLHQAGKCQKLQFLRWPLEASEPHNANTESLIHSEVIKVNMWGLTMDENFTLSPNVLTCGSVKQHSSKILQSNHLVMSQWAQPSFIYSLCPSCAYNTFETVTFHTEKREKSALATHNFQNQKSKRSRTKPQESLILVSIHIKQVVIWIMQSTKNRKNCDTPWERICISLWSELKFM